MSTSPSRLECKSRNYFKNALSILGPRVLMSHLKIKATCDGGSKSRDKNVFTFCQDGQCCSTSPLTFQNENCNKEQIYQGTEIGECAKFKFRFYTEKFEGNVTYKGLPPEMDINLLFKDDSVTECTIVNDNKLDVNEANGPTFLDFSCDFPHGMFFD